MDGTRVAYTRAISGISRPSSARCAFQPVKLSSSSCQVLAALGEPNRLRRVGSDPVLVPGDLPRDRHDHLAADPRERDDRRLRRAEALGDAGDRAAVSARVEEIGRFDDGELGLREAAQDRLVGDRSILRPLASEERAPEASPAADGGGERRHGRAPLAHPAVLQRDLLAERADVDVLAAVRRETNRVLARQERALADRAGPRDGDSRGAHRATVANAAELSTAPPSAICHIHMYRRARNQMHGHHARPPARRTSRALPGRCAAAAPPRAPHARLRPAGAAAGADRRGARRRGQPLPRAAHARGAGSRPERVGRRPAGPCQAHLRADRRGRRRARPLGRRARRHPQPHRCAFSRRYEERR